MSRRGNCWDNAVAESFFSSLKKKRIRKRKYKTRDLARADIFDYIEVFAARKARHDNPTLAATGLGPCSRFAGGHATKLCVTLLCLQRIRYKRATWRHPSVMM
jgi:hypothetical protein